MSLRDFDRFLLQLGAGRCRSGATRLPGTWTPDTRLSAHPHTEHKIVLDPTDGPAPDEEQA